MTKKKLPVSLFELIWYPICAAVIIWGIVYVVLGLVNQYNDLSALKDFCGDFKSTFKLELYFWGLIIIAIGVVAAVAVMLFFAKSFDRVADREQRRSARLSALKKEEKVVDEQQPEFTSQPVGEPVEQQPQESEPEVKVEVAEAKTE